jgi:hypothetical protein
VTVRRRRGNRDDPGQRSAGQVAGPGGLQRRPGTPLRTSTPRQWPILHGTRRPTDAMPRSARSLVRWREGSCPSWTWRYHPAPPPAIQSPLPAPGAEANACGSHPQPAPPRVSGSACTTFGAGRHAVRICRDAARRRRDRARTPTAATDAHLLGLSAATRDAGRT